MCNYTSYPKLWQTVCTNDGSEQDFGRYDFANALKQCQYNASEVHLNTEERPKLSLFSGLTPEKFKAFFWHISLCGSLSEVLCHLQISQEEIFHGFV